MDEHVTANTRRLMNGLAGLLPIAAAAVGLASCSFLIDFPSENTGAGGAGDGGAGGTGGGADPPVCEDFAADPAFERVVWKGTLAGDEDYFHITTSGLARHPTTGSIYAYGRTRGGLFELLPVGFGYSELFLVEIPIQGAPTLAWAARACDLNAADAHAGRMTVFLGGAQVISGALGYNFTDVALPQPWSVEATGNECANMPLSVLPYNFSDFASQPFFALIAGETVLPNPALTGDGESLDVDNNAGFFGAIGVSTGEVFGAAGATGHNYFVQRSTEKDDGPTFVLTDHFLERHSPAAFAFGEGAVAVDDDGTVWFGGGSCESNFDCLDQGAFLGRLPKDGIPSLLVERPEAASAITAMDLADHVVVMGGRYQSSLELLGSQLPTATASDAFVMALDSQSQNVLWTYPTMTTTSTLDQTQWEAVVDLAILGDKSCGAVYVTGCSVLSAVAGPNCVDPAGGKRGFIVKLDLATGQELWVGSVALQNPNYDIFLPTALRAFGEKVYLAASAFGSISVAGATVEASAPMQTFVVELSR